MMMMIKMILIMIDDDDCDVDDYNQFVCLLFLFYV